MEGKRGKRGNTAELGTAELGVIGTDGNATDGGSGSAGGSGGGSDPVLFGAGGSGDVDGGAGDTAGGGGSVGGGDGSDGGAVSTPDASGGAGIGDIGDAGASGGDTDAASSGKPGRRGGRPPGSRNRKPGTGNTGGETSGADPSQVTGVVVGESPKRAEFSPVEPKETRRRVSSSKIDVDGLGAVLTICFAMYGKSRPPAIRNVPGVEEAWIFSPDELRPVSEPLAKIIGDLPAKYSGALNKLMGPAQLIMGGMAIFQEGAARERASIERFQTFLQSNPEAASRWDRANPTRAAKQAQSGGDGGGGRNGSGPPGDVPARDPGLPGLS